MRDPWAVGAAARAAGARAPETLPAVRDAPRRRAGRWGVAAQAAAGRRWARRSTVGGRPAGGDGDPPAPDPRTVVLGGGDRRRPPRGGARPHRAAASQAGVRVDGQRDPAAPARSRARRTRRSAARRVRRDRGTLRRAGSVRGRRGLGRAPRLGARGQPASARLARVVRAWQLRGACPSGARPRAPHRRHTPGDDVCQRQARAVCKPRLSAPPNPTGGRRAWSTTSLVPARRSSRARPCAR